MNKSESIKNLAAALTKFQKDLDPVKRDAINPFFKSKYADLSSIIEAVREPLASNGLSFSQFPSGDGGLTTILMHESGEWLEETFTLKAVDAKPQSVGSALTYSRRYALGAVLGIATEIDDDGNTAQGATPKAPASAKPYVVPTTPKTWKATPTPEIPLTPNGAPKF